MFLRMHSLLFYLHSKCLMLDTYPTFHINQPPHHRTFRSAYGSFRAFTAHDHKPCMKVLFDS